MSYESWEEVKLGDICQIKHGYAFKGEFFSDEPTNNLLLTPGNFAIGGGFKSDKFKYYHGKIPKDYILKANELIVTMTDLSKEADTLGYAAKVPIDSSKLFLHNQRLGLITLINEKYDADFIYWLMRSEHYQKFVAGSATGATVKHTSPSKILAFKVKLPPLPTQKKIAKILSNYDDLIENNLKQIELLEERARLTYEEWFLRFRIDGQKLEIDKESGLPFGWEKKKVGDLLAKVKNTTKIKKSDILKNGINPVVDQSKEFIVGYTNETNVNKYNDVPFIVFGDHTRILKFINFSFARGADGTQVLVSNNPKMPQVMFYHALVKIDLSNYHYARHYKFLKVEEVIVPTLKIAKRYEVLGNMIFETIKNLRVQNQLLKESRDILLPRLMMGVIDVKNIEVEVQDEL